MFQYECGSSSASLETAVWQLEAVCDAKGDAACHHKMPSDSAAALPPCDDETWLLPSVLARTQLLIAIKRDPEAQNLAVISAKSANVCIGSWTGVFTQMEQFIIVIYLALSQFLFDLIGDKYSQNVSKQLNSQLIFTCCHFRFIFVTFY